MGLTLNFDPNDFSFVSARTGSSLLDATLAVNSNQADKGKLGLALALPPGHSFAFGSHQVVVVTLRSLRPGTRLVLQIGDDLIKREVVDIQARQLETSFTLGVTPSKIVPGPPKIVHGTPPVRLIRGGAPTRSTGGSPTTTPASSPARSVPGSVPAKRRTLRDNLNLRGG